MLVNLVTNVVIVIMFGFYTTIGALDSKIFNSLSLHSPYFPDKFYWPFLVVMLTPVIRIMLVGHWAQVMKDTVRVV